MLVYEQLGPVFGLFLVCSVTWAVVDLLIRHHGASVPRRNEEALDHLMEELIALVESAQSETEGHLPAGAGAVSPPSAEPPPLDEELSIPNFFQGPRKADAN